MRKVTVRGYQVWEVISAFQKEMRRGNEEMAMYWFLELEASGFWSWACKRILVCLHEDVGLASPETIQTVTICVEQAKEWYKAKSGDWMVPLSNAILAICRAPKKTRESGHFIVSVLGKRAEGYRPDIPDYALDQHTLRGKQMGRGEDFFREHSAKLSNPAPKDKYEDAAYEVWKKYEDLDEDFVALSRMSVEELDQKKGLFK